MAEYKNLTIKEIKDLLEKESDLTVEVKGIARGAILEPVDSDPEHNRGCHFFLEDSTDILYVHYSAVNPTQDPEMYGLPPYEGDFLLSMLKASSEANKPILVRGHAYHKDEITQDNPLTGVVLDAEGVFFSDYHIE